MLKIPICIYVNQKNLFNAILCVNSVLKYIPDAIVYLELSLGMEEFGPEGQVFLNNISNKKNINILQIDENERLPVILVDELMKYKFILQLDAQSLVTTNIERKINSVVSSLPESKEWMFLLAQKCMSKKRADYCKLKLSIEEEQYMDFSTCIVNTEQCREAKVGKQCKNYIEHQKGLWFPEEDALNVLFGNQCVVLGQGWNMPVNVPVSEQRLEWYTSKTLERIHICKESFIWNYMGDEKEQILLSPIAGDIWKYVIQTSSKVWLCKELGMNRREFERFQQYMDLFIEKDAELKKKEDIINELKSQMADCVNRERAYQSELEEIRKSLSYRLAMKLTFVPRIIRTKIKKGQKEYE